ncbi:hypothetical protein KC218_24750, partial [Mycobacterium tuberculosis]|nr:hypothetical protein [Mycobacterium tuberculosis]
VKVIRPRPLEPQTPAVAADGRVVPARPGVAVTPPQPQHGVVVVRKPLFFGLFGPEVDVTERVVVLPPPAPIGATRPAPPPP